MKEIISEVCMFIENIRESLDKNDDPAIGLTFRAATMAAILGKRLGGDDDKEDDDK